MVEAAAADGVAGLGDPNENVPLPTMAGFLVSSVLVVAAGAAATDDPKLKEELATGVVSLGLAVAANDPKVTAVCFAGSVDGVVLGVVDAVRGGVGCPKEKPVLFAVSAGGLLAGEPKLNPPLVVVVEVTVSELFDASDAVVAGLEPKLNPPEAAGLNAVVGSFFSAVLGLSVVSETGAAGLIPKLNPLPLAGAGAAAAVLPLLPKLNLGLSSELVVLVVDVTEPKLNPVLVDDVVVGLVVELAGTPKVKPVVLGASLPSASEGSTPKLNFAPAVEGAGLLPKEKEGAFSGVEPGLACSQHAHFDREASFRVIQALHSHLLADCWATRALKP